MRVLLSLLAVLLATSCGQRGPLYLRESPPPGMKAPKPEPYQPVPYPKESSEEQERGKK
jgi:predicted small lipoprotein YifL